MDINEKVKEALDYYKSALLDGDESTKSFIFGKETTGIAMVSAPNSKSRTEAMAVLGMNSLHANPELLVFISLAWMSTETDYRKSGVMPSKDPARREIIVIAWQHLNGTRGLSTVPVIRTKVEIVFGEKEENQVPLGHIAMLEAFWWGVSQARKHPELAQQVPTTNFSLN